MYKNYMIAIFYNGRLSETHTYYSTQAYDRWWYWHKANYEGKGDYTYWRNNPPTNYVLKGYLVENSEFILKDVFETPKS